MTNRAPSTLVLSGHRGSPATHAAHSPRAELLKCEGAGRSPIFVRR
jgi:hypothetical protein